MADKINKYNYEIIMQGNYGYGWEDEIYCEDYKDAKEQIRTYRDNVPHASYRIIHRREINPEWEKKNSLSGKRVQMPVKKCGVKLNFKGMI